MDSNRSGGDDRFYTPRNISSFREDSSDSDLSKRGGVAEFFSESESYRTARLGQLSDGEYRTPRTMMETKQSFDGIDNFYTSRSTESRRVSKSWNAAAAGDEVSDSTGDRDIDEIFSFARHGRYLDIEQFLEKGIPVDVRDELGNSLLIIACQNGNKRVAKLVLRRGANINARNHRGNTPLHYCFHFGYGESLGQYLISKGADVNIRNKLGKPTWEGL